MSQYKKNLEQVLQDKPEYKNLPVSERLEKRWSYSSELFEKNQKNKHWPIIEKGFETFENFLKTAKSILNSRKSSGGKALEAQLEQIFKEENIEYQPQSTDKKIDFTFKNNTIGLSAKTILRERWKQVIAELPSVNELYLFTLDKSLTKSIIDEALKLNIGFVLLKTHSEQLQNTISLEDFIDKIK